MHRLAHADGEVGTSKACAARHVPMILSALSNDTLEDVSAQSSDGSTPYAIQVSPFKDRQITTNLLVRAKGQSPCPSPRNDKAEFPLTWLLIQLPDTRQLS